MYFIIQYSQFPGPDFKILKFLILKIFQNSILDAFIRIGVIVRHAKVKVTYKINRSIDSCIDVWSFNSQSTKTQLTQKYTLLSLL